MGLCILNFASGYATIEGAKHIVGHEGIAVYFGIAIQLLLFLMLTGLIVRSAPLRKWTSVLILSFVSVYTSFFTYYHVLTAPAVDAYQLDTAIAQHNILVRDVYTELESRLEKLVSQKSYHESEYNNEVKGKGASGIPGLGGKAQEHLRQASEKRKEIADLEPIVVGLKEIMDYPTETISDPNEIFDKDSYALSQVPTQYLPPIYHEPLDREKYGLSDKTAIKLMEPYYMVVGKDIKAIPPLIIACMTDGLAILLGTTIKQKKDKVPFQRLSEEISNLIKGFQDARKTIMDSGKYKGIPYDHVNPGDSASIENAVEYIELTLGGQGSKFLEEFFDAIDTTKQVIDNQKLSSSNNLTFKRGYKFLLVVLQSQRLQWIEVTENDEYKVMNMNSLCKWINLNLNELYRQEAESTEEATIAGGLRDIRLELPRIV